MYGIVLTVIDGIILAVSYGRYRMYGIVLTVIDGIILAVSYGRYRIDGSFKDGSLRLSVMRWKCDNRLSLIVSSYYNIYLSIHFIDHVCILSCVQMIINKYTCMHACQHLISSPQQQEEFLSTWSTYFSSRWSLYVSNTYSLLMMLMLSSIALVVATTTPIPPLMEWLVPLISSSSSSPLHIIRRLRSEAAHMIWYNIRSSSSSSHDASMSSPPADRLFTIGALLPPSPPPLDATADADWYFHTLSWELYSYNNNNSSSSIQYQLQSSS